jgi:hypothetical protein
MIGGLPKGGKATFNSAQHGLYTVNSDCTGTMQIFYDAGGAVPAGVETDLNIVVAAEGTLIESVVYRAVIQIVVEGDPLHFCNRPGGSEYGPLRGGVTELVRQREEADTRVAMEDLLEACSERGDKEPRCSTVCRRIRMISGA